MVEPGGGAHTAAGSRAEATKGGVTSGMLVRLGLVLTIIVLLLASVRFARYDWAPIRLELIPDSVTREVSTDCTEQIGTYITNDGRIVEPVTVDDEQYMSMVAMYRGVERADLQSECIYRPYVSRFAQPWVASLLPFGEATSLAITNVVLMVAAVWAMLAALRAQRVSARTFVVVGTLFAVGWNTLMSSSVIMTDSGILAAMTFAWWLVASRRLWWALAFVAVAVPIRETVLLMAPVILAAGFAQARVRARSDGWPAAVRSGFGVFAVACVVIPLVALLAWGQFAPEADASWGSSPRLSLLISNALSPSLVAVVIAGFTLFLPALLYLIGRIRSDGWFDAVTEPAAVGFILVCALCVWVLASADLSPRFLWVGFPFAASMTADWLAQGHLGPLLERLAPERLVGADDRARAAG